jgi:hypothetical protein
MWDMPGNRGKWKSKNAKIGFFPKKFEDMSTAELVITIDQAPKMNVTNSDFWEKASVAVLGSAFSMNPKQITAVVNAFQSARWKDKAVLGKLAKVRD